MDISTASSILLAVAVIIWLGIRQTRWSAISPSRAWRSPLLIIGIGAFLLISSGQTALLDPRHLGALLVELLLGAAVGGAIGMIAHLRPVTRAALEAHATGRRATDAPPTFEARNGGWGLALWIAMIVARVGLGFLFAAVGVTGLTAPAAILILLGVNRLARTAVIVARANTQVALAADASSAR